MHLLPSSPLRALERDAELHLDFSTFRREIQDEEQYRNPLRSHIRVERIGSGLQPTEERKHNLSLDNYTFDLTLGDEEEEPRRQFTNSELFLSWADTPYTSQPDSNQSVD